VIADTPWQHDLAEAIESGKALENLVEVLRDFKNQGIAQADVYRFLRTLQITCTNESIADRIAEVADFVVGFCSPTMKVWDRAVDARELE
jgi:hypothetical protein